MSKYCVCCQNKELNSLSHHKCYLLALVADYDGATLMSEMMMLVMMAIIITLKIMVMTMSIKTLEAFLRIFIVWIHKTELKRIPALIDVSEVSTSHLCALNIKQGLVLRYEKSLSESCLLKLGFISVSAEEIYTFSKGNSLLIPVSSTYVSYCDTFNHFNKRKSIFY